MNSCLCTLVFVLIGSGAAGANPDTTLSLNTGGHTARVWAATFTAGDKALISVAENGEIREWDLSSGQSVAYRIPGLVGDAPLFQAKVAISPWDSLLAVTIQPVRNYRETYGRICLLPLANGHLTGAIAFLQTPAVAIRHLSFVHASESPEHDPGYMLVAALDDGSVRLWESGRGSSTILAASSSLLVGLSTAPATTEARLGFPIVGAFRADGNLYQVMVPDGASRLTHRIPFPDSGQLTGAISNDAIEAVVLSDDASRWAILRSGLLTVFGMGDPIIAGLLAKIPQDIQGACFSPDARRLLVYGLTECAVIDFEQQNVHPGPKYRHPVTCGAWSRDGRVVVTAGVHPGELKVWQPDSDGFCRDLGGAVSTVETLDWTDGASGLVWSANDTAESEPTWHSLAWSTMNPSVSTEKPEQHASDPRDTFRIEGQSIRHPGDGRKVDLEMPLSVAERVGAQHVAVGTWASPNVSLVEVESGEVTHTLSGHEGWVNCIRATDTGSLLATSSSDATIRIWRPLGGSRQGRTPREPLVSFAFLGNDDWVGWTPNGKWLGTKGGQSQLGIWQQDGAGRLEYWRQVQVEPAATELDVWRRMLGTLVGTECEGDYIAAAIWNDLRTRVPKERWAQTRYVSFSHWFVGGDWTRLRAHKCGAALIKMVNSLSWSRNPIYLEVIDPAATLFRLNLSDGRNPKKVWDSQWWKGLESHYPYATAADSARWKLIRERTGAELPVVRGDWFCDAASRPPLYHLLAAIPTTERRLERLLGCDTTASLREGTALRVTIEKSQVSRNYRVLDRHEFRGPAELYDQTRAHTLWRSHDFASRDGRKDVFVFPAGPEADASGFERDGGELIFELPNGLHAYMIVSRSGGRLDEAPLEIVQNDQQWDPNYPVVGNGLSCILCHDAGIKTAVDAFPPSVAEWGKRSHPERWKGVAALHDPDRWSADGMSAFQRDSASYLKAMRRLQPGRAVQDVIREPILSVIIECHQAVDIAEVAAELGTRSEVVRPVLLNATDESLASLSPLLTDDGRVTRATFLNAFGTLSRQLTKVARANPSEGNR